MPSPPPVCRLAVTPELDGAPLDRTVRALLGTSWAAARALVASGKVSVDGARVLVATTTVRSGARLVVDERAPSPRAEMLRALDARLFVHLDAAVAVVRKPAGISTVPFPDGRSEPDVGRGRGPRRREAGAARPESTLDDLVRRAIERRGRKGGRSPLGVVQRLDKETSGILVFARTLAAKRALEAQLRAHSMYRRYVAIAQGTVRQTTFRSNIGADRGDGRRGSVAVGGQWAVTHVEPLEALDGATLVSCRLETGRTHQIRIHLSEAGHPIAGERVYLRARDRPSAVATRLMLHAVELGFEHPTTGEELRFSDEPPDDFQRCLDCLRRAR